MDLASGVVIQQGGRHLEAAGVVDTDEQDLGDVLHDGSFGLGEGAEAFSGEAVDEQGDEVDHPGARQPGDGLVHEPLDGLQRVVPRNSWCRASMLRAKVARLVASSWPSDMTGPPRRGRAEGDGAAGSTPGMRRRQAVPLGAERASSPRLAARRTRAAGRSR
jgi:hypothetical protein